MLFRSLGLVICMVSSFNTFANRINEELSAVDAFYVGKVLYQQFKEEQSLPYLKYAADQGIVASRFLYGVVHQSSLPIIRQQNESEDFILQAAEAGYLPALKWEYEHHHDAIAHDMWRHRYYNAIIDLGRADAAQAFYLLADYFRDVDVEKYEYYLQQAVKRDYPAALVEQSQRLSRGQGPYLVPSVRVARTEQTYLRAAQTHDVAAMRSYVHWLESEHRFVEAFHWREQALKVGDILALAQLGFIYAKPPRGYEFIEPNLNKSNFLLEKYINTAGFDRFEAIYNKVQRVHDSNISICNEDLTQCQGSLGDLPKQLGRDFTY